MAKLRGALESLRGDFQAHREIVGRLDDSARNTMTARNVLHEDLGYFEDSSLSYYDLDEHTRDRLIAHARQDASHAAANTITLIKYQKWNRRLLLLSALVLIYIAWKVG